MLAKVGNTVFAGITDVIIAECSDKGDDFEVFGVKHSQD